MKAKFLLAMTLLGAGLGVQSARAAVSFVTNAVNCPNRSATTGGILINSSLKFTFANSIPPYNAVDTRTDITADYARSYPPFDSTNTIDPTRAFPALYPPDPDVGKATNDTYRVFLCINYTGAPPSNWRLNMITTINTFASGLALSTVQARARVTRVNGTPVVSPVFGAWRSLVVLSALNANALIQNNSTLGVQEVEIQYRLNLTGNERSNPNPYLAAITYIVQ